MFLLVPTQCSSIIILNINKFNIYNFNLLKTYNTNNNKIEDNIHHKVNHLYVLDSVVTVKLCYLFAM